MINIKISSGFLKNIRWRYGYLLSDKKNNDNIVQQIQQKPQEQLTESLDDPQSHSIIPRAYKEIKVPGLESARKYTNLTQLQQEVIKTNKFDLQNPQIVPKSGTMSSFAGVTEDLTEISLGKVKIKGKDEVFLSEVDPENIPADLNIRFDGQKELKIIGRETDKPKEQPTQQQSNQSQQMQIQAQTIQQKSLNEHLEQQFGIGVKGYKYSNTKSWGRWDLFLTLVFFSFLIPFTSTLKELYECYKSTKAIEDERMKEITQMKKRSYQRVLFENEDFNRIR